MRALLGLLLLVAAAPAASAADFANARLTGFGGARRALGSSTEAVYVNPAGLAFARRYDIETSYADDFRGGERSVNLTVADGQAGAFAGALAIGYHRSEPDEPTSGLLLEGLRADISVAFPLAERFSVGFGARYLNLRLIDGDDEVPGGGASEIGFDGGIQWRVADNLALGASIQNFTGSEQPGIARSYGAGVGYSSGGLELEADISHAWESEKPAYTLSGGYLFGEVFPLRVGVAYLHEDERFRVSGGLGFIYESLELDLGYAQTLGVRDAENGRVMVATLRIRAF